MKEAIRGLYAVRLLKWFQLENAFWDTSGQAHNEVVTWLQSNPVLDYLDRDCEIVLTEDLSFAIPQLHAIRAALTASN